jgi:hypothetical protein
MGKPEPFQIEQDQAYLALTFTKFDYIRMREFVAEGEIESSCLRTARRIGSQT